MFCPGRMGTLRILSWLLRGLKSECVKIDIPINVQPPTYFGKVLAMKECTPTAGASGQSSDKMQHSRSMRRVLELISWVQESA